MAQATVSTTLTERMFTLEDFYNYDVKSLKISRLKQIKSLDMPYLLRQGFS